MSFPTGISPDHALELALAQTSPLDRETVALSAALGRVLAEPVVAEIDLPPFDNSAMDGYALRSHDLREASSGAPVELRLRGTIAAGQSVGEPLEAGQCWKIMTGAPVPPGSDAVVMHELSASHGDVVSFEAPVEAGTNVRRAGDDLASGEEVLRPGEELDAARWALLAALGREHVRVHRQPRVGIIVTGQELAEAGAMLQAGQIHDSNSWALRGQALEAGATIVAALRCGDTAAEFGQALESLAPRCDLVVSSGGASAGDFEPARDFLLDNAHIIFWKISMKPGKPVMLASWRNVPVLALPGNPVSVMVGFELLARPMLLSLGGAARIERPHVTARLRHPWKRAPGRTEFVRARLGWTPDGVIEAEVTGAQGSGRLSSMARANALLEVAAELETLRAGDTLVARLLGPLENFSS